MSPEFALLGFIYYQPMHGYELHHKLIADLGHVWHLSQSEAYAILKRLENQGYLSNQRILQEKLPSRQLLQITSTGRMHFEEWLQTPSGGSIRAIRMEFLTRLYFISQNQPENIEGLINMQRAETENHIQRLKMILTSLSGEQIFNRMSLEMRIRQLNLILNWLEDCKKPFSMKDEI